MCKDSELYSVLGAESGIHERRLLADLLEHYNKLERPVQGRLAPSLIVMVFTASSPRRESNMSSS
jgi:hypothetical protein